MDDDRMFNKKKDQQELLFMTNDRAVCLFVEKSHWFWKIKFEKALYAKYAAKFRVYKEIFCENKRSRNEKYLLSQKCLKLWLLQTILKTSYDSKSNCKRKSKPFTGGEFTN